MNIKIRLKLKIVLVILSYSILFPVHANDMTKCEWKQLIRDDMPKRFCKNIIDNKRADVSSRDCNEIIKKVIEPCLEKAEDLLPEILSSKDIGGHSQYLGFCVGVKFQQETNGVTH